MAAVVISPSLHVPGTVNDPPFPLNHARIGYQSIATAANVTATSEAAGFPASAATNDLTYDQWRPETLPASWTVDYGQTVDVDYLGIAAHTFADNRCSVSIEYSTDGATWKTLKDMAPGDGSPIMLIFSTITARFWRVTLDGDSAPAVGVIKIGEALAMQRSIYGGHKPGHLNPTVERIGNESEGGQSLGLSVIRRGVTESFSWDYLKAFWVRDNLKPFARYAEGGWFFIAWNPLEFPAEVVYGRATGKTPVQMSNMGTADFMQASMTVRGVGYD